MAMMSAVTTSIDELRDALREMVAAQRRMRGREAQHPDKLRYAPYQVLRVLTDGEVHSAGELATAADLTPGSLTKMLDGLSDAGLVERVRDVEDRRRVAVRITEEGRSLHDEKDARIRAAWESVLGGADAAELEAMATALRRVAALYDSF